MKARNLTPFEHVVFVLLDCTAREWRSVGGDRWPAIYEGAVTRLVDGGLLEAKVPVRILTQSTLRLSRATWRVTGEYREALRSDIRDHMRILGVDESDYVARPQPFTAVRLTPDGEVAKLLLREILVPHKEPSDEQWGVMWAISGGPSGDGGNKARGRAICLEDDKPLEVSAASTDSSPALVTLSAESFRPLVGPLKSIEDAIRGGQAAAPRPLVPSGDPPVPSPIPDRRSQEIVGKLDALLRAAKCKQCIGRFGAWKPRDRAHNNRIVEQLLDAIPDMTSRDAAMVLGATDHTAVVRTDTWKRRRGGEGADASSYAEHHQNMQYDEDVNAEHPAKVVANREEQAAQLRKAVVAAGLTSKFRDLDDDEKLLEDAAALSTEDSAAFSRLTRAWEVVQCTAPHQPEDS